MCMQHGTQTPLESATQRPNCTFCQRSEVADVLKETPHFLLAADHAPLVEGHLLVIPKDHYACYGDAPTTLDEELFAIKDELRQFYTQHYAPVVFWEHGVFRQTVFHAHLHCFPWGNLSYDLESNVHNAIVTAQEDIRSWYHAQGHYFYLEDEEIALLFRARDGPLYACHAASFPEGSGCSRRTRSHALTPTTYQRGTPTDRDGQGPMGSVSSTNNAVKIWSIQS